MQWFKRPLKLLGILTALLGAAGIVASLGYLLFLGMIVIGIGLVLFVADVVVQRHIEQHWRFRTRISLSVAYLLLMAWVYADSQKHNTIIFPKGFSGEAGIIFGVKGYPPLPETEWWEKRIAIPSTD